MSTCISHHGEYSSHDPDEDHICRLCEALDEDTLITEVRTLRARLAAVEALAREWETHPALDGRPGAQEVITGLVHQLRATLTDTTKEN